MTLEDLNEVEIVKCFEREYVKKKEFLGLVTKYIKINEKKFGETLVITISEDAYLLNEVCIKKGDKEITITL